MFTHGAVARQFPSGTGLELTNTHRGECVARQCGPVGGTQNDEQRGDRLFDPFAL